MLQKPLYPQLPVCTPQQALGGRALQAPTASGQPDHPHVFLGGGAVPSGPAKVISYGGCNVGESRFRFGRAAGGDPGSPRNQGPQVSPSRPRAPLLSSFRGTLLSGFVGDSSLCAVWPRALADTWFLLRARDGEQVLAQYRVAAHLGPPAPAGGGPRPCPRPPGARAWPGRCPVSCPSLEDLPARCHCTRQQAVC